MKNVLISFAAAALIASVAGCKAGDSSSPASLIPSTTVASAGAPPTTQAKTADAPVKPVESTVAGNLSAAVHDSLVAGGVDAAVADGLRTSVDAKLAAPSALLLADEPANVLPAVIKEYAKAAADSGHDDELGRIVRSGFQVMAAKVDTLTADSRRELSRVLLANVSESARTAANVKDIGASCFANIKLAGFAEADIDQANKVLADTFFSQAKTVYANDATLDLKKDFGDIVASTFAGAPGSASRLVGVAVGTAKDFFGDDASDALAGLSKSVATFLVASKGTATPDDFFDLSKNINAAFHAAAATTFGAKFGDFAKTFDDAVIGNPDLFTSEQKGEIQAANNKAVAANADPKALGDFLAKMKADCAEKTGFAWDDDQKACFPATGPSTTTEPDGPTSTTTTIEVAPPTTQPPHLALVPGLQYSGTIYVLRAPPALGLVDLTPEGYEISGPVFPKVSVLYQHEGDLFPSMLSEEAALARDGFLVFEPLLTTCKAMDRYADRITIAGEGVTLTQQQLAANYNAVAECSYGLGSKPYPIPKLIHDLDVCTAKLGDEWRMITENELMSWPNAVFTGLTSVLGALSGTNGWGNFYFSPSTYVRTADGDIKVASLAPGVTPANDRVRPAANSLAKQHTESASINMGTLQDGDAHLPISLRCLHAPPVN